MADRVNQLSRALDDARRQLKHGPAAVDHSLSPSTAATTAAPPPPRPRGMWAFITGEDRVPY
jgi:hypothetical protein